MIPQLSIVDDHSAGFTVNHYLSLWYQYRLEMAIELISIVYLIRIQYVQINLQEVFPEDGQEDKIWMVDNWPMVDNCDFLLI